MSDFSGSNILEKEKYKNLAKLIESKHIKGFPTKMFSLDGNNYNKRL